MCKRSLDCPFYANRPHRLWKFGGLFCLNSIFWFLPAAHVSFSNYDLAAVMAFLKKSARKMIFFSGTFGGQNCVICQCACAVCAPKQASIFTPKKVIKRNGKIHWKRQNSTRAAQIMKLCSIRKRVRLNVEKLNKLPRINHLNFRGSMPNGAKKPPQS